MNSFRNFGEDKLNELLLVYSKIITIVNSYAHSLFYKKTAEMFGGFGWSNLDRTYYL